MVIGQIFRFIRRRLPRQLACSNGKNGMHSKRMRACNLKESAVGCKFCVPTEIRIRAFRPHLFAGARRRRNLHGHDGSGDCEFVCFAVLNRRQGVVEQVQVAQRVGVVICTKIDAGVPVAKRGLATALPVLQDAFDLWRIKQAGDGCWRLGKGLRRRRRTCFGRSAVVIVALNLMLRAIATSGRGAVSGPVGLDFTKVSKRRYVPLRECLVAADMPPLARLATFARLGVTTP